MNTRATITVFLFLGWSATCTWWYTCKIKGVCLQNAGTETFLVANEPIATNPEKEIETESKTPVQKTVTEDLEKTTILFSAGSVTQEHNPEIDNYLEKLALVLKTENRSVIIIGHTDFTGEENTNQQLGMQRAESVKSILVHHGADAKNITCISKGENEPVASNETEEGKRLNRRVEIKFNSL